MRSVSFLFVNTKRVSSTIILFEQFMRRCFKKVGELVKDKRENFNEEERDTLSIPISRDSCSSLCTFDYICMLICTI